MEDRRRCVGDIFSAAELGGRFDIIFDVCGVSNAPAGSEFIQISNLLSLLHTRVAGRIAIVNVQVAHVTISHLIALSADFDREFVRTFYSEADALAWLALQVA